jgi:exonuclease VII small subunit
MATRQNKRTLAKLESLDNRIRIQTLEQRIAKLESVIAALETGEEINISHRHSMNNIYTESHQLYSAIGANTTKDEPDSAFSAATRNLSQTAPELPTWHTDPVEA